MWNRPDLLRRGVRLRRGTDQLWGHVQDDSDGRRQLRTLWRRVPIGADVHGRGMHGDDGDLPDRPDQLWWIVP